MGVKKLDDVLLLSGFFYVFVSCSINRFVVKSGASRFLKLFSATMIVF